jgi:hypothetical protein
VLPQRFLDDRRQGTLGVDRVMLDRPDEISREVHVELLEGARWGHGPRILATYLHRCRAGEWLAVRPSRERAAAGPDWGHGAGTSVEADPYDLF